MASYHTPAEWDEWSRWLSAGLHGRSRWRYGHVWVTLAVIVKNPAWGTIGLPFWSWLYVRRQDVPTLAYRHRWTFRTKLDLAAELIERAVSLLKQANKQQVRNVWTNIAVWHLNLWMHTLTELWAWRKPADQLVHREDSPWDHQPRRPSHADRRKSLQACHLVQESSRSATLSPLPDQIRTLLQRLLRIAI